MPLVAPFSTLLSSVSRCVGAAGSVDCSEELTGVTWVSGPALALVGRDLVATTEVLTLPLSLHNYSLVDFTSSTCVVPISAVGIYKKKYWSLTWSISWFLTFFLVKMVFPFLNLTFFSAESVFSWILLIFLVESVFFSFFLKCLFYQFPPLYLSVALCMFYLI